MPEKNGVHLELNPLEIGTLEYEVFRIMGVNLANSVDRAIRITAEQQTANDANGLKSGFLRQIVELHSNELREYLEVSDIKELTEQQQGESYA